MKFIKPIVLIVGMGSAGSRHAHNAIELGYKVIDWDASPRSEFLKFLDASKGLTNHVVIASPPNCHRQQVLDCLDRQYNVLCEKPLGLHSTEVQEILEHPYSGQCYVGYQMRFLRSMRRMRGEFLVQKEQNDNVLSHSVFGHDIKQWHRFGVSGQYVSRIGVLLEASHELDYILWAHNYDIDYAKEVEVYGAYSYRPTVKGPDGHLYDCNESIFNGLIKIKNVIHSLQLDYETATYTREWILRSNRLSHWKYNQMEGYEAYKEELAAFLRYTSQAHELCTVKNAYVLHTLIDDLRLFNLKTSVDQCNAAFKREEL